MSEYHIPRHRPHQHLAGRSERYFFGHRKRNPFCGAPNFACSPGAPHPQLGSRKNHSRGSFFDQLAHPNHTSQPEAGDHAKTLILQQPGSTDRLNPYAWWFNAGTAVLLRRETNLLPVILLDSTCLAKVYKRVRRCPALWLRERLRWRHARFWSPDAPFVKSGKPDWSVQGLVWSSHVRSGDLLFRGARRRYDGHGRQGHGARQLSVVIRA